MSRQTKKNSAATNSSNYIVQRLKALPWHVIIVVSLIVLAINGAVGSLSSYNQLVVLRNDTDAAWQQVEVQYQRRLDLIPNLVATVEGGQIQERNVLTQVTEARSHYNSATSVNDRAAAASSVETALGRLMVVVEAYPTLQSNDLVKNLQAELAATENKISVERLRYNEDVQAYNTYRQVFPHNIVAAVFHFDKKVYFEASPDAAAAPKVQIQSSQQ